jgi:DNA repair protein RadC
VGETNGHPLEQPDLVIGATRFDGQRQPVEHAADLSTAIRPRDRLLQHGAHTLTDAELVSVLLSSGRDGTNALVVADQLLRTVGGVPGLTRCHPEALCRLPGLGQITAARLVAALALPLRRDTMSTIKVSGLADLVPVFRPLLAGLQHERLAVAVCDRRLRVRAVRSVADGPPTVARCRCAKS